MPFLEDIAFMRMGRTSRKHNASGHWLNGAEADKSVICGSNTAVDISSNCLICSRWNDWITYLPAKSFLFSCKVRPWFIVSHVASDLELSCLSVHSLFGVNKHRLKIAPVVKLKWINSRGKYALCAQKECVNQTGAGPVHAIFIISLCFVSSCFMWQNQE